MFKIILTILLAVQFAFAASSTKLVDYMINGSGIVELLAKYEIKGNDAQAVKGYVNQAMKALVDKNGLVSKADLTATISKLPLTGPDANIRKELQLLLDKSDDQLKKEDVVKAVNHLIYLANRNGKAIIITCADCVNENLAKNGFKFTVDAITNSKNLELLNNVIPSKPEDLSKFVTNKMKKLGLGDYSKVSPDQVSPSEERSMALFLALAENGSAEQKAYVDAVKKLSTTNGKVNIIDPKNSHKFWRELGSDKMTPDSLSGMTEILNQAAEKRATKNLSAEDAFYETLKEKADKNPELKKDLEALKAKRCFFK